MERQIDKQIPCCQAAIVHSLLPLVSILEYTGSVTLLKRVLDVLLKVTGKPVLSLDAVDQLLPQLTNILKARVFNRVVRLWMLMIKSRLIQTSLASSVHWPQTIETTGSFTMREKDCDFDAGLLNTVMRKLILFLLKFTAVVLEKEAQCKNIVDASSLLLPIHVYDLTFSGKVCCICGSTLYVSASNRMHIIQ